MSMKYSQTSVLNRDSDPVIIFRRETQQNSLWRETIQMSGV